MVGSIKIEVYGLQEALSYLKKKNQVAVNNVKDAISDSTIILKREVKDSIAGKKSEPRSVDTGEFLNSIDSNSNGFDGVVFTNVPHSLFMEYGTTYIPERRHFRNSAARLVHEIETKINNAIKKV